MQWRIEKRESFPPETRAMTFRPGVAIVGALREL
jgi:hypothetical protein